MRLVDNLLQDARYALRVLRQKPGFAAVAVLSLALRIGANTAIFSLVDTVLLRSLPVRDPDQLAVFAVNPDKPAVSANYPDYLYIRDHNRSFSGVAAYGGGGQPAFSVAEEGAHATPELVTAELVSGNFFEMLGVTPAAGRLFTPDDNIKEDGHPWVVLDHDFWLRRFASDPAVIDKKVTINTSPFTVIGVAYAGFRGVEVGVHPDIYVPIMMRRAVFRGFDNWNSRHVWWLRLLCRLKPGVTRQTAISEVDTLWHQIIANDPERRPIQPYEKADYEKQNRALLLDASAGYSYLRNQIREPLTVLMIVVALVLLIACANVANLLLARAAARQREIAIRLAVGAGRSRLVRQLVLESIVIALAGGIAGGSFAWLGVRVLLTFLPDTTAPAALHLTPDWRLLAFSFAVCLTVGLICGIAPALQSTRPNLTVSLKTESASGSRIRFDLRRALVVAQVAISLLLLIGAGLFVRSLQNLKSLDPGFVRERVLLVNVNPVLMGYQGQRLREFYERLLARTRTLPEVRSASLAMITPLAGGRWNSTTTFEGYERKPTEKPWVDHDSVSRGYFETMGIPLTAGRDFRDEDNPAATPDATYASQAPDGDKLAPPQPVAIINQAAADQYFSHQNPIGRHFSHADKFDMANSLEIIGVVRNSRYYDVRKPVEPMVYIPVWRERAGSNTLCIRTTADPERLAASIRREVSNLDSAVPVLQTTTLAQQFDDNILQERTVTTLCGFFGALAVLLAAIGLYGVMAHSVTRRYREIGIRMALGAERRCVMGMVLRESAWMIAIGAAIGLPAAFAITRLVQSFLFGLTPQDPLSIALATVALALVTGLAGYIPALRATRVDPMIALRYE